jgi:hypothetical protein
VQLKGIGQLKNSMTSSGIEPACSIVKFCENDAHDRIPIACRISTSSPLLKDSLLS